MTFDYNVIATGLAAPVAVLLVKTLLDFSLAHAFVKWFWWLLVRSLFRDNPPNLSGNWEHLWGSAGSAGFAQEIDRHSHTDIRQFGRYCYGEFRSKDAHYCVFGRIKGDYWLGDWYDTRDKKAYFGTFQLLIVDSKKMEGKYIGHSRHKRIVQESSWNWTKRDG